jgi:hypothetical protein
MQRMEEEDMSSERQSPVAMDSKPSAKVKAETPDSQTKVKKKRKSPAVPWKKPKDMPKRPLSAYNLFFKEDRERILTAGPETVESAESPTCNDEEGTGRPDAKHGKTSGIGFSNLTKRIAIRWQQLDSKGRAPYEKRAAIDKKRYDEEVLVWRTKRKEVAKKQAEKSKAEDLLRARPQSAPTASGGVASVPLEGLFDEPYPSTWFETHAGLSGVESHVSVLPTQGTGMRDAPHPSDRDRLADSQMPSPPHLLRPLISPQLVHMFQNIPVSEMHGSSGTFPESNSEMSYTRQQFVPPRTRQERTGYAQSMFLPTDITGTASTLGSGSLQHQAAVPDPRRDLFLHPFTQRQAGDMQSTDDIQESPAAATRVVVQESLERLLEDLDDETVAFMTSLRFP